MATITPTTDRDTAAGGVLVTWDAMATGDDGAAFGLNAAADITIQVTGYDVRIWIRLLPHIS